MVVVTSKQTPPAVIDRANLSRAVLAIGGEVLSLDIHLAVAEKAYEDLMLGLDPLVQASPLESDRQAYQAAMDEIRPGEYAKTILTLDQLRQAADKLEEMVARMRKLENSVLIPSEGEIVAGAVALGIAQAVGS